MLVPDHQEARQRLDLHEYQGGLYTTDEIKELQQAADESKKAFDIYQPRFLEMRNRAAFSDSAAREAAFQELREVSDLAALPALDDVCTIRGPFKKKLRSKLGREAAEQFVVDFNLAAVAALGNMPQHEATMRLVGCVVDSPWPEIRQLAGTLLKPRPKTDFVPALMGALTAPIEADVDIQIEADGVLTYGETIRQQTPQAKFASVVTRDAVAVTPPNRRGRRASPAPVLGMSAFRAARWANEAHNRVALANAAAQERNLRIQTALKMTTDMNVDLGAEPEVWWQAWRDENGLYYDESQQPTYETYDVGTQYYYLPAPYVPAPGSMSCFAAGTQVWTKSGPVSIEDVHVGDMVLSQSPQTGELAYRPVYETTLRPPSPTVNLTIDDETITATLGHRFWVDGRGWQMARLLKQDMPLHSLDGRAQLAAIEQCQPGEEVEAYNLGVDDFHTYVVGKSRLLVHDNSCPRPTTAPIPGMTLATPASLAKAR